MASRRQLDDVRSVLDVGCGVGHWGTLLVSVLSPEATITGVDREDEWVDAATRRAAAMDLAERCSYRRAAAKSLPFDDASFDLVTCQTVLIHVRDPRAAIREMLRVTKPGRAGDRRRAEQPRVAARRPTASARSRRSSCSSTSSAST